MTLAICFKCGSDKSGALLACSGCGTTPRTHSELALSLVLTDNLSSKSQLAHYSHELRNHLKLSVPSDALAQAQEALKDPQLMAMLGAQSVSGSSATSVPTTALSRPPAPQPAQPVRNAASARAHARRTLKSTVLHQAPFAILGVTTRDDRRRIVELAEEKSLELDHDVSQKARSDLTNPRTRLSAEIAWLPGVSPRKASQLLESLLYDPMAVRDESGLPTLAHVNLLAAAFDAVDAEHDTEDLASFIQEVAYLADELDPEDILRDINEDRAVSGFPEVRALDQISAELAERKRYYRSAIKDALDRLPPTTLVEVMTDTVDGVTSGGEDHAPELIDDLVDSYEVETQGFLQKEAENVRKLIKAVRDSANSGEAAVKPYVDKLDAVARNWDKVAQPIQLSAKARGIGHEASRELAYEIRSLAIDLFNTHDMLTQSQRLTGLLQELFAELPEVSERVEQDADALADISQRRNESDAIDPLRMLCERIVKAANRKPRTAYSEGLRLLNEGAELLKTVPVKANSPIYIEAQNLLAIGILQCAITYGNATSDWKSCISLLESSLHLASDKKIKSKIRESLSTSESNHLSLGGLEPIKKAPSLTTFNGIGFTLYGSTDKNPADGSYIATYYFVLLYLPIFPIARYRVIPTAGGFRFLGRGSLRTFDKWHIAISIGLIVTMFLNG